MFQYSVSGVNEEHVYRACRHVRQRLDGLLSPGGEAVILGPAPLPVVKVNNRYRYRVMIYAMPHAKIRGTIAGVVIECCNDKRFSDVSVFADNDPND